jgi:hypothetical protein
MPSHPAAEMTRGSAATYLLSLAGYWVCATLVVDRFASAPAGAAPSARLGPVAVQVVGCVCLLAVLFVAAFNWQVVSRDNVLLRRNRLTPRLFVIFVSPWGLLMPVSIRTLRRSGR